MNYIIRRFALNFFVLTVLPLTASLAALPDESPDIAGVSPASSRPRGKGLARTGAHFPSAEENRCLSSHHERTG